jgi:hypothetical protein
MFKNALISCVCGSLCLAAGMLRAQSEDRQMIDAARKVAQKYEKAVVVLAAVLKIEAGSREQEAKSQCVASIIDPSGLAVTSYTYLNPVASRKGVDCQVQEVKYHLADGTELPARLVLKDEDLDVAFLAPLKPLDKATEAKITSIPLGDAAVHVEPLDATILISHAGEDFNYIPLTGVNRIAAVLTTPRTCYLLMNGTSVLGTDLGVPMFNAEGKLLGIVSRCIRSERSGGSILTRLAGANSAIILPAADLARMVPQAKEEAKKAAEAEKKKASASKKKSGDDKKKGGDAKKKSGEAKKKSGDDKKTPGDDKTKSGDAEKKPADAEKKQP